MEKIITAENIREFAYVNEACCQRPIRGIVLSFFGLGAMFMYDHDNADGEFFGEHGILYVVPYSNPWAWMNRQAAALADELVDVLLAKYGLPDTTPIVSSGGSMGGQSALTYMVRAKRTPVACVVNCPVCDMPYHYTERPDLPRTMYSALAEEEGTLQEALERVSPLHLVPQMPVVPYHFFHCAADQAVKIAEHSDKMVAALRARGIPCTYEIAPNRPHCDLPLALRRQYDACILAAITRETSE